MPAIRLGHLLKPLFSHTLEIGIKFLGKAKVVRGDVAKQFCHLEIIAPIEYRQINLVGAALDA